jgi:hypothetical protein
MDYGRCATESTDKKITAKENGRKLTLENPNGKLVRKIQVDGCLITDNSHKRCDYMFEIEKPIRFVIYLELKGSDIKKAYEQLVATIDLFIEAHRGIKKDCHIVASRVPQSRARNPAIKNKNVKSTRSDINRKHRRSICIGLSQYTLLTTFFPWKPVMQVM